MRKITLAIATTLVLGALAIALPKLKSEVKANPATNPPATPQLGADACRNVQFKFTNMRNDHAKIRFDQIEYWVASKNRWQVENINLLSGGDCNYEATCMTTGNNLRDALDRDLTQFRVIYRYLPNTAGANWSSQVRSQSYIPDNPRCSDNRIYGPGPQGWRIPPQ